MRAAVCGDRAAARVSTLRRAVSGRNVMITGASSGIGRAAAVKVAAAGGVVLAVARRRDQLDELCEEIALHGGVAHAYACDLSDPVDIDRMAAEALRRHGHVDILVNNAGRSIRRAAGGSYDRFHDFQRTMQLNYFGALRLILDLLPAMRERRSGHIVNVSTAGVQTGGPLFSAYLASKAALDAFSRTLSFEVAEDGVCVSTVCMPLVRTPMITPTPAFEGWRALTPEQGAALVCTAIRTRRPRVATPLGNAGQVAYALAPRMDHAVNALILRLRSRRPWRSPSGDPAAATAAVMDDPAWRATFRRRLERAQVPTDPDEVRRLTTLLRRIPLFAPCDVEHLHRLAATAYPVVLEEGEVLCAEGDTSADCFVVVEGEASVRVQGTMVGAVGPGEVVGERAPIEGRPRSAAVTASTRVLAYAISSDRLETLLREQPGVAAQMRAMVQARYRVQRSCDGSFGAIGRELRATTSFSPSGASVE